MTTELDDVSEIYWMFLTFMTLEPRDQLEHLEYVPVRGQAQLIGTKRNPLIALLIALQTYSWRDDFYPDVRRLDEFREAVHRFATKDQEHLFCREAFESSPEWGQLRELAKCALQESGMEPHPIPERIDFRDFIEYHADE